LILQLYKFALPSESLFITFWFSKILSSILEYKGCLFDNSLKIFFNESKYILFSFITASFVWGSSSNLSGLYKSIYSILRSLVEILIIASSA